MPVSPHLFPFVLFTFPPPSIHLSPSPFVSPSLLPSLHSYPFLHSSILLSLSYALPPSPGLCHVQASWHPAPYAGADLHRCIRALSPGTDNSLAAGLQRRPESGESSRGEHLRRSDSKTTGLLDTARARLRFRWERNASTGQHQADRMST